MPLGSVNLVMIREAQFPLATKKHKQYSLLLPSIFLYSLNLSSMDPPNPKTFPLLSYALSRLSFRSKPPDQGHTFDIEQPPLADVLLHQLPHLTSPTAIAVVREAVAEVVRARSALQVIGDYPDHESVDNARTKIMEIDSKLSKKLEDNVLSPRPSYLDPMQWRSMQAQREADCRKQADAEKEHFRAVIRLEEMHDSYERLLKEAEGKLAKIYESAALESEEEADVDAADDVDGEIARILRDSEEKEVVERVDFSGRMIRVFPEAIAPRLPGLLVLDLSSNQIQNIPDSISELASLEQLNVSSNLLLSLPDSLGILLNLKVLDASGNKLTSLPDTISHCRSLVELDVSFNSLTYLPTNLGFELVNLRRLSVHLNKLRSLPSSVTEMRSLRQLDAHFNELRSLPRAFGRLRLLETVNLSNNFSDLRELPDSFCDLENLRELDLGNNQIHALPDMFGRLENLTKLKLEQNPLEIPPAEVVGEGVEAVKLYMTKRWLDILLDEEQRSALPRLDVETATHPTGWLARSTSWLGNFVSGVADYVATPKANSPKDGYLEQQR